MAATKWIGCLFLLAICELVVPRSVNDCPRGGADRTAILTAFR
jgi:hypothetical protein